MRNPVNAEYLCPFVDLKCTKRSQQLNGPYPVCSVYKWGGTANRRTKEDLICVCPNRLFQAQIERDIISNCWPGEKPTNPQTAFEVKLSEVGKIDWVIADIANDQTVNQFVSVELQTVDITGSCFSAYSALINSSMLEKKPSYSFNWKNVYKRYIMQLIFKGLYHHHWGTKIIAVMQDVLVERLWDIGKFTQTDIQDSNIVFLSYKMVSDLEDEGRYNLELVGPIGTQHINLMNSIIYQTPPSKDKFVQKILDRIV